MNGSSITRRSSHRLTVTIGDAAIRAVRATVSANAAGTASKTSGNANHGTAEITRSVDHTSPPASTETTLSVSTLIFAWAPVRTSPPCATRYSRAGSAYISCSGVVGSPIAAARASPPNISPTTRAKGGAAAWSGGWLSAASASGFHSISRIRVVWPLRISQFSTVSPGDATCNVDPGRIARRARRNAADMLRIEARSRHDRASHSSTAATRCSGDGNAGQTSRDRRPRKSIIVTASCGCTRTRPSAPIVRRNSNVST